MLSYLLVVSIRVYLFSQRVVAPSGARLQNMLICLSIMFSILPLILLRNSQWCMTASASRSGFNICQTKTQSIIDLVNVSDNTPKNSHSRTDLTRLAPLPPSGSRRFLCFLPALRASHGSDSPKRFESVRLKHLVFVYLLFSFSLTALSFIDLKVVHLRLLASHRTDGFKAFISVRLISKMARSRIPTYEVKVSYRQSQSVRPT